MSMTAQQKLELERERRQALRLGQVRGECRALLEACEEAMRRVTDVAPQQLAASALSRLVARMDVVRTDVDTAPASRLEAG